jgi:hypothetical protein
MLTQIVKYRRGKERLLRGGEDGSALPIYIWRQHKETHQILFERGRGGGEWEYNRRSELEGILYKYVVLSQWNPLILQMYDKPKIKNEE